MMISSGLAVLLALTAAVQVRDAVTAAQEVYTGCLGRFAEASRDDKKSADDFAAAVPRQCTAEEAAFRQAMIRRDTASRISAADAEQAAKDEIDYARQQAKEKYEFSVTPR